MSKGSVYKSDIALNACYVFQYFCIIYTMFQKKLDPLLFRHIFALTATIRIA